MQILHVRADESGIQDGANWCLVTGFIGTPDDWDAFEEQWAAILDGEGVGDFHAKDFFSRHRLGDSVRNYYRGWSGERAKRFIDALLDTLIRSRLYGIGGAVEVSAFNALGYGYRKALTGGVVRQRKGEYKWGTPGAPSKPYFVSFEWLILEVFQCTDDNTLVHFLFDEQKEYEGGAVTTYTDLKTLFAKRDSRVMRLGEVGHDRRERVPGLQAADLQTHLLYSYLTEGENMSNARLYALNRLRDRQHSVKILNGDALALMVEDFVSEPGGGLGLREFVEGTGPS